MLARHRQNTFDEGPFALHNVTLLGEYIAVAVIGGMISSVVCVVQMGRECIDSKWCTFLASYLPTACFLFTI